MDKKTPYPRKKFLVVNEAHNYWVKQYDKWANAKKCAIEVFGSIYQNIAGEWVLTAKVEAKVVMILD